MSAKRRTGSGGTSGKDRNKVVGSISGKRSRKRAVAGGKRGSGRGGGKGGRRGGKMDPKTGERIAGIIAGAIVIAVIAGIGIVGLSFGDRAFEFLNPAQFSLKNVEVKGRVVLERGEVIEASGLLIGASMIEIDLSEIRDRTLKHPRIKAVVLEAKMPHDILITIEERVPIGLVQQGSEIMGIDADGTIIPLIPSREEIKAPIITGEEGLKLKPLLRESLEAIHYLRPDLVKKMSEVALDPKAGITLTTVGYPTIIRLGRGNMRNKIEKLRTVLNHIEEKRLQKDYIDLRFEDIITQP